ncbi:MAG: cupin domain-containing protein [Acidimicrobiales bacterium]
MEPHEIVELLNLSPHPEGGRYRQTWRDHDGAGSAIYFLLQAGERSRWHRIDRTEVWHLYAGGPLELSQSADGVAVATVIMGSDLAAGQRPQAVVAPGSWQAARPLSGWVLVGCTVSPAFDFAGFELAPSGWEPGRARPTV